MCSKDTAASSHELDPAWCRLSVGCRIHGPFCGLDGTWSRTIGWQIRVDLSIIGTVGVGRDDVMEYRVLGYDQLLTSDCSDNQHRVDPFAVLGQ